jgi:hypothetical protein
MDGPNKPNAEKLCPQREAPLRAVNPIPRSQCNGSYGADCGRPRRGPTRNAIRPTEASKSAVFYVRNTMVLQWRRRRQEPHRRASRRRGHYLPPSCRRRPVGGLRYETLAGLGGGTIRLRSRSICPGAPSFPPARARLSAPRSSPSPRPRGAFLLGARYELAAATCRIKSL